MRLLKSIFDFYLDASIHVALAVVALYFITIELLEFQINVPLAAFVGLSTIVCYNFIKYGVEADKYLIVSNSYHKIIQVFSFLCFGFAFYFAVQLRVDLLLAIIVLGILSILYALPVLPNAQNLRSLGVIKIFIVALVWAGFTVLLPVIDAYQSLNWDTCILFCQRFLMVLALMLPFEIRDMAYDKKELRTLPQRLGVKGTQLFGIALITLYLMLTFFRDVIGTHEMASRLYVTVAVCFFLIRTKKLQSPYFSSFWVESIPISWYMVLLALKNFL